MLRELREFKSDKKLTGSESIDEVIGQLEDDFIEEEMNKALSPKPVKKTKTDAEG